MQRFDRPATTTFIRYHHVRAESMPLVDGKFLETIALFALLSVFWGIILFFGLTQGM
jgi:hypothetical protein